MNAVIRLDDKGNPYLIVNYEDKEGDEQTASDDAERLFFTRLNQNGGLLHLVPGKGKQVRMLVTTGGIKRQANVTESNALGNPHGREELKTVSKEVGELLESFRDLKKEKDQVDERGHTVCCENGTFEEEHTCRKQPGNDAGLGPDPNDFPPPTCE